MKTAYISNFLLHATLSHCRNSKLQQMAQVHEYSLSRDLLNNNPHFMMQIQAGITTLVTSILAILVSIDHQFVAHHLQLTQSSGLHIQTLGYHLSSISPQQ